MMLAIGLGVGVVIGFAIGVVFVALMAAAAEQDEAIERRLQHPAGQWPDWWPDGIRRS